eukprot:5239273-Alexandrium_andersonii.AAC.1
MAHTQHIPGQKRTPCPIRSNSRRSTCNMQPRALTRDPPSGERAAEGHGGEESGGEAKREAIKLDTSDACDRLAGGQA